VSRKQRRILQLTTFLGWFVINKKWYVYIVECSDGSFYTGITVDVDRRILEHNYSFRAAKYTRSRRPVSLKLKITVGSQSEALKLENKIKKMSRKNKINLMESSANEL